MEHNYFLPKDYKTNPVLYFDDTSETDGWQREVYEYAEQVCKDNNYTSVLDIGCGSAFKLIKHFNDYDTLGLDLPPTVAFLKNTYPTKKWSDKFEPVTGYDMVICSDVIEHLENPEELVQLIKDCKPKCIIFSTPDKGLRKDGHWLGPPQTLFHVREWSFYEFAQYMDHHFNVVCHIRSNIDQSTQLVHCILK